MTGYIGIGGTAKKIKNIYIGVGGTAKQVKKAYIGVGGVAKLWYSSQREWVWDVYTLLSGYEAVEAASGTDTRTSAFYAGTSYTLDQSTGQFSVDQTINIARSSAGASNAVGKYFVIYATSSGTQTGATVYLITAASYSLYRLSLTLVAYTSRYYEGGGSLIGSVSDVDITTYPLKGAQDGFWYMLNSDITLMSVSYTGAYTDETINMTDGPYRLLTLTGSGVLTLGKPVKADIWICGGGGSGGYMYLETQSISGSGGGGAGAYAQTRNDVTVQNLTVQIGAGAVASQSIGEPGGITSISTDVTADADGGNTQNGATSARNGGTGGGAGFRGGAGTGDGIAKLPFGDGYFAYPFCDGGGGGRYLDENASTRVGGGNGGTDGGNGYSAVSINSTGLGGGQYGGDGSDGSASGSSATGYGSGGGGGGYHNPGGYSRTGGSGYQGVCFIRIPLE